MVRATAAEMVKLFGGVFPPGHDAATFGTFAAQADSILDTLALPATLSTTGTNEISLANRVAVHLVHKSMWFSAGGVLSGTPEPEWIPSEIIEQLRLLAADTDYDGFATADMIDESDY